MRTNRLIDGGARLTWRALWQLEAAEHEPGRNRLAMEAFARALEILNTRLEFRSRRIDQLNSEQRIVTGTLVPNQSKRVRWKHRAKEAAAALESAISAATETWRVCLESTVVPARGD